MKPVTPEDVGRFARGEITDPDEFEAVSDAIFMHPEYAALYEQHLAATDDPALPPNLEESQESPDEPVLRRARRVSRAVLYPAVSTRVLQDLRDRAQPLAGRFQGPSSIPFQMSPLGAGCGYRLNLGTPIDSERVVDLVAVRLPIDRTDSHTVAIEDSWNLARQKRLPQVVLGLAADRSSVATPRGKPQSTEGIPNGLRVTLSPTADEVLVEAPDEGHRDLFLRVDFAGDGGILSVPVILHRDPCLPVGQQPLAQRVPIPGETGILRSVTARYGRGSDLWRLDPCQAQILVAGHPTQVIPLKATDPGAFEFQLPPPDETFPGERVETVCCLRLIPPQENAPEVRT